MTAADIIKDLKNRKYKPIYLLHGDETYFIDAISDLIESKVLSDSEKSFNQTIVYGKDLKMPELMSMARRYPMMSDFQLIIVKDAQDLKEWDIFLSYVENPLNFFCFLRIIFNQIGSLGFVFARITNCNLRIY